MTARRTMFGALLLGTAVACAPQPGSRAPQPLKPENGPSASIRVGYSGGLLSRSLSASFRTERDAYVLVGHLGGDGVIRVLFPATPFHGGLVRGKETHRTPTVLANYDGAPSLFSYTMSPFRSLSSLYDSYDGRGHGYVFIVVSDRPLRYGLLEDGNDWSDWRVDDYLQTSDPRYAVRGFADAIASSRYTLKFAGSFTTSHYDAYASRAWDCALLSNQGFFAYSPWWNAWGSALWALRSQGWSPYTNGCGPGTYQRYAFWHDRGITNTLQLPRPQTEPGDPAPTLERPGRRGLGGPQAEPPARNTFTRVSPSARPGAPERLGVNRPSHARPTFGERPRDRAVDNPRAWRDTPGQSRPSAGESSARSSEGRASSGSGSSTARESSGSRGSERAVTSPRQARSGEKKPDGR